MRLPIAQVVGIDGEIAEAVRAGRDVLPQDDELLRLRVVRQAQKHVAHDGEHDDGGADAEGESKKGGRAESRASPQLTHSETQFAEKSVHDKDCLLLQPGYRCRDHRSQETSFRAAAFSLGMPVKVHVSCRRTRRD